MVSNLTANELPAVYELPSISISRELSFSAALEVPFDSMMEPGENTGKISKPTRIAMKNLRLILLSETQKDIISTLSRQFFAKY